VADGYTAGVSDSDDMLRFDRARISELLENIERLAAGDMTAALPVSTERGDELDAIAHAVNMLADELRWTSERKAEVERQRLVERLTPRNRVR
jgi:methyl-accepting chemotaxis protein